MGNIWQALIKCILHIFYRKFKHKNSIPLFHEDSGIGGGRVVPTTLFKLRKNWVISIGDNLYWWKKKEIPDIGVFLDRNLSFIIRVFIWDLANDLCVCKKKYGKPAKHIDLIWEIWQIIQYQLWKGSHNVKVLQLD